GPAIATDETASQTLSPFSVSVTGTTGTLGFTGAPAIDLATGTLTYQAAPNTNGTASVSVTLKDSGGVANTGVDTSPAKSFTITVSPLNDAPVTTVPGAQTTPGT